MNSKSMAVQYHPLHGLLDQIWNEGHTPKIIVDATYDDVIIPENVRAKWKENLPIDLSASYPLNIDFSVGGLSADLAFSGSECRCTFPWARIRSVIVLETGKMYVVRKDGEEAPPAYEPTLEAPAAAKGWTPRVIRGGKS